ncbi:AsmA family protein [uncultured Roseobacter sp.]|uniref:AsmA family protein n=1 Tax=uncultured Roseobacter sp. TaxID=114847 RepID=UPI0026347791|nr:AsmA family protein [uncultured Roseobacter sp.]
MHVKWIIRLLGLGVVIAIVAIAALFFLPAERIARLATDQLQSATGRTVSISGDVGLTFWPVLGIRAAGLEIGNADWAEQGPLLQAASVAIGIDAMALLGGDIRITNIEAESPMVRLEQRSDGQVSWEIGNSAEATPTQNAPTSVQPARTAQSITVQRLAITDASLIYAAAGSDPVVFDQVDLTLDWPEAQGAATITARLRPAATPVSVEVVIDGFAGFIAGETQTLRAAVSTDAGRIALDGRGSADGAVAGDLTLSTGDTNAFLRALGMPGADLPPDLGGQIDLSTALTVTAERAVSLRDLVVSLGRNRISGAADLNLKDVPQLNAQLDIGDFVLPSASAPTASSGGGGGGQAGTGSSSQSGWPTAAIDASALGTFNGEIALTANSIDLGQFDLGATRALLRNDNSRMVFELRDVAAYGGDLTGTFVINNRSGLSVGGDLTATGIEMQPLLTDAADLTRLTGTGAVQMSFLGVGASVDAIMKSLSGKGSLQIGRGTILGIDLDRLMRSGDVGSGTTVFDSLTGSWTIAAGTLQNNDLLLQLKSYQASGAGAVGLGSQTVDYTVTPIALRANSGQGVSIPVRFTGPWSNISIRPDVEAALKAEIDEKAKELEERAKEKLNERLGVSPVDGRSTGDAVKDELNDRLLKKLFD